MTNLEAYGSAQKAEKAWYKHSNGTSYLEWLDMKYVPEETLLKHTPIFDLIEKKDPGIIGFNPVGINSPDWISIIVEKDGKWLAERQLRYGKMEYVEEIPSGMVEAGEDPKVAAHRELLEETGYRVDIEGIKYLGKFQANPAFMSNCMHYFYVNLDEVQFSQGKPNLDPHEKIEVYWVDKREFYENYFITQDSVFKAGMFLLMQKNGLM